MFYYFKMSGVATMSFNSKSDKINKLYESYILTYSILGILYNLSLICLIVTINYYGIFELLKSSFNEISQFSRIIDIIVTEFMTITSIIILLRFSVQQNKAITIGTIVNKLKKMSMILNNQQNKTEKSFCISIIIVFVSNFIFWVIRIILTPIPSENLFTSICFHIAIESCTVINITTATQYNVILLQIKQIFKIINDSLLDFSKECAWIKQIGLVHSNNTGRTMLVEKLQYSRRLHFSTSKISEDVSDFYSFPMFFNILQVYMSSTLYTYYVGEPVILGNSALPAIVYLYCCLSVCALFAPIINLTKAVSATVSEVINLV